MIRLQTFKTGQGFGQAEGIAAVRDAMAVDDATLWIRVETASSADIEALASTLGLHPMTVEDLEHDDDRPRLRQYDNVLSLLFFAVAESGDADTAVAFNPVRMFATRRYLMTITDQPMPALDEALARWKDNGQRLPPDAGAPMYCVLDTLVDAYFPVIDRIADDVDDVEDQVVSKHAQSGLPAIFALKKSMLRFRRVASAGRDVVNTLMVRDEVFSSGNVIFMQDVYDHLVRITDSVDTYRDLLSNAMESYLSVTSNELAENSNRLNVTMQVLTSWSIIIGCSAFITGVYGMNVEGIPFAHSSHGFLSTVAIIAGVSIALLAMFRRKGWV